MPRAESSRLKSSMHSRMILLIAFKPSTNFGHQRTEFRQVCSNPSKTWFQPGHMMASGNNRGLGFGERGSFAPMYAKKSGNTSGIVQIPRSVPKSVVIDTTQARKLRTEAKLGPTVSHICQRSPAHFPCKSSVCDPILTIGSMRRCTSRPPLPESKITSKLDAKSSRARHCGLASIQMQTITFDWSNCSHQWRNARHAHASRRTRAARRPSAVIWSSHAAASRAPPSLPASSVAQDFFAVLANLRACKVFVASSQTKMRSTLIVELQYG